MEVSTIKSDPNVGSKENFYKSDMSKEISQSVPFVSSYSTLVQSSWSASVVSTKNQF